MFRKQGSKGLKQGVFSLAFKAGIAVLLIGLGTHISLADENQFSFTGAIEGELRVFAKDRPMSVQAKGPFPTVGGWFKASYQWNDGNDRITFMPYARADLSNTQRDLVDVREGYYLHQGSSWDVLIGSHIVFWGVTESRHLVDVVNQTDITGEFDQEDKLGQPMINLNITGEDTGTLSLYGLFGFRERNFPGKRDRLRPLLVLPTIVVSDGNRWYPWFTNDKFKHQIGFAARYSKSFTTEFGSFDIAPSYFYGKNREARFVVMGTKVIPVYDMMHQIGLEALYEVDDLQLKFEGLWRSTDADTFFAAVGGFEYFISDPFSTGADLALMGEFLFDDRNTGFNHTVFDHDVFVGVRVSFNDVSSTKLEFGAIVDVKDGSAFISAEFSRRILDSYLLNIKLHAFDISSSNSQAFLNDENFVQMRLTRFF
jgi:hypothetical protein